MTSIDLNGAWTLSETNQNDTIPATVPGCVHTDLLAAGKIPDPWFRDNEKNIHWVANKDWVYERQIVVDSAILERDHVVLRFEGLDTFCKVEVNGITVLKADNMHRTWEVDVKEQLHAGENHLQLTFSSPIPYMKERDKEMRLHGWNVFHEDYYGKSYVRKMACAFGWDWGLMAPTAGIWRPAQLLAYDARIEDVTITQKHAGDEVILNCRTHLAGKGTVRHRLMLDGAIVCESHAKEGLCELVVDNPMLWWPNGMGEQPLYELVTELVDEVAKVIDTNSKQLGLRTCELIRERDEHGECFRFRVNGRDLFTKGGNWIPCDIFPSRIEDRTYRQLLESCASSHMNMIRVWGGGIYEDERFYDLCDELGLLVWQDFMFACSTYPSFDKAFMENVAEEARDNVRRLRHRACLALWCGNNELEQGLVKWDTEEWTASSMPPKDYLALFDELLPAVLAEEDTITPYWPSSGHTPGEGRHNCWDDTCGDAHSWSVWFGGQPIEAQREWKFRFMSEFGFQSYPELKTVESFTAPEDRNMVNWVMDYHQRSGPGNQTILKYAIDWFQQAKDFESSLVTSQLIQALCVQYAAEHARRIQGRMDGLLYWQINDIWPGATWSSIDVYGRWKALQYFARRFFNPIMVSLLEDPIKGTVNIHVSNHRATDFDGTVKWWITNASGNILKESSQPVQIGSQINMDIVKIDCQPLREAGGTAKLPLEIRKVTVIPMQGDRDLLVWAVVKEDDLELSRNLAFFAKPKYWKLKHPEIQTVISKENGRLIIDLSTTHCAPWTRLSLRDHDCLFSDNFLHLAPHLRSRVSIEDCSITDPAELADQLIVTPFFNLFA